MVPVYFSGGKIARATVGRSSSSAALISSALKSPPRAICSMMRCCTSSLPKVSASACDSVSLAFRQRCLCFPAQIVQRETPLDGGGAQSRLRDHIVQRDALVNQLGQRRRFLQRRHVLPLQILDGGDAQRVVLGEVVADFDRDGEILRQFAALLQELAAPETAAPRDDLEASLLPLPCTGLTTRLCRQAVGPDAGGKALDGLAVDLPARVRGGWLQRRQ